MKQPKTVYTYLTLTIIIWSVIPAVAKLALNEINNFQLLLYSTIIGVISLFFISLIQGKLKILTLYTKKDYFKMFGMGLLGICFYHLFLYGSFDLIPAGQANIINYLWPIFVIVFSIFILKEKFNYKTIIAILCSFFGALIIFTNGTLSTFNNQYSQGYVLAALGAVCYGLFSVLGKKLEYEKVTSIFIYYISAAIILIPATMIFSEIALPKSLTTIISILALGGIMNSIGFVFWFKALKLGNTHKTANIIYIVPFLAMIWTYVLNSELISVHSVIGLILIVFGIFIQIKNKTIE